MNRITILPLLWLAICAGAEPAYRLSAPVDDPADPSIWPNQASRANSDPWLAQHHDSIRRMEPRVLVINFHNQTPRAKLEMQVSDLITALGEASRYHGYSDSNAPVFLNYAGYDLKDRWNVPFSTLYELPYHRKRVEYPAADRAVIPWGETEILLTNYFVIGGNAHWPPNARGHYDLDNKAPVLSTIEDWWMGSGPAGADLRKPFTNEAFSRYRKVAPDCMGAWLIYWRQNMPGLDNRQKDELGKPMKNWWPFLFY
jgi:hypothetical protein